MLQAAGGEGVPLRSLHAGSGGGGGSGLGEEGGQAGEAGRVPERATWARERQVTSLYLPAFIPSIHLPFLLRLFFDLFTRKLLRTSLGFYLEVGVTLRTVLMLG